jgi:general stress protein 26
MTGTSPTEYSDRSGAEKVAELIKGIKIAMFTTVDEQGNFISRPMAQQEVEFDGDLWFFAERSSRKIRHLAANPQVGVTLSSGSTWVSLNGSAEMVTDDAKARELWNSVVEAWMPQGAEDPNTVLIKFHADTAEYWDTPGGRIASVLSFVKAKATGQPYSGGENETVNL